MNSSPIRTISAQLLEDAVCWMLGRALPDLGEYVSSENLSVEENRHRPGMHAVHLAGLDMPVEFAKWLGSTGKGQARETGKVNDDQDRFKRA